MGKVIIILSVVLIVLQMLVISTFFSEIKRGAEIERTLREELMIRVEIQEESEKFNALVCGGCLKCFEVLDDIMNRLGLKRGEECR